MNTISQIANKKACGGDISANTGKLGCLSLFGTPDHLLAIRRGSKIPSTTVFDLAYITPMIQTGAIIPLMGASAFEDQSAEDSYSTNSSGVKRLNLKGLPEYKFMYEEGHEFYRQLDKLEGYKNFDYIIGDDEGNWMLATNSDGSYSGFSAGHTTPELTKRKVPGGDAESKSVLIQFLERSQFDRNYAILHQKELTFTPMDIQGVNGVEIKYNAIPTEGGDLDVQVVLAQDRNTPVEGLTQFAVVANGVSGAATASAGASPGQYTLSPSTPTVADDIIVVKLGTSVQSVSDSNGALFRAIPNEATVSS